MKRRTLVEAHAALNLDLTLSYEDLVALSNGVCASSLPSSFPVAIDIVSRASLESRSVDDLGW